MLIKALSAAQVRRTADEDVCSQINYRWLALVIFLMGVVITMAQYVGDPIHCWCLAEFTDAQCNYTKAMCWIQTNYHIRQDQPMRQDSELKGVSYYPWIPWMLFAASAFLNLPHIFWTTCCATSGLNLSKIIAIADVDGDYEQVASCMKFWLTKKSSSKHIQMADFLKSRLAAVGLFWLGKRTGNYFCGLIIFTKLMYFAISFVLFLCLNIFIDGEFKAYGIEAAQYIFQGVPLNTSRFPKLTMCHIKVRQMQNVLPITMQCVLPINIYNEKIFIFLWLAFPVLMAMNACSLLRWGGKLLFPAWRKFFVRTNVAMMSRVLQECEHKPLGNNEETANGSTIHSTLESSPTQAVDGLDSLAGEHENSSLRRRARSDPHRHEELEKQRRQKRKLIDSITNNLLKFLGKDGVAVFHTLQNAVGFVAANQIFQKLYEQLKEDGRL